MRPSQPFLGIRILRWSLPGIGLALVLAGLLPCFAQQMHRNAFEGNRTSWIKGAADVDFTETAHTMTDQIAHQGQRSEYIQINAKDGSHIYYYYPVSRAPVAEDLSVSIWVKSNHPGLQLMARVVLPKEADPSSLQDRLTTVIRGDTYRKVGGWQRLEIPRPVKLAQSQQQLMQLQFSRPINMQDAYVDKLILNVYGGSGVTDVWIDELEVGPVYDAPVVKAPAEPTGKGVPPNSPSTAANGLVNFNGSYLQVDGKRFFFRGIRCVDTPPKVLRDAGFNTLFVDAPWDPARIKEMADLGFWLVPSIAVNAGDARVVPGELLTNTVHSFPEPDNVLFWYLGTALAAEQFSLVDRSSLFVKNADRQHGFCAADVWDDMARYSNKLDMVSLHRWPLMTTLELNQYRDWLQTRSRLATPHTFLWTWIQTQTPDFYTQLWYQKTSAAGFTEPIGPQPEQVRLLTYLAVGSGFRGIGFWSDRFLAESHQGHDRMLTVALLNQELEFLEPMLTTSDDSKRQWIETNDANVKAAVIRTQRGILVLPIWLGSSAQIVPGQAADAKLTMTVPQVPDSYQCFEVSPGEVHHLKREHGTTGGMTITVPDFSLTAAIVFTSDISLLTYFQERCYVRQQAAAQYTYNLAVEELRKVVMVEEQLDKAGHTLPDSGALLKNATDRLAVAKDYLDHHQYGDAYKEAQRALRPARILMRSQWDMAVRQLDTPVASPYAVSFYTLPQHWEFMAKITAAKPDKNLLVGGDFEVVPGRRQEAWLLQETTLDDVEMRAERVAEAWMAVTDPKTKKAGPRNKLIAKEGKQFTLLTVVPKGFLAKAAAPKGTGAKDQDHPVPKALERTYLAINSPEIKVPPGTLVKISGWMAVPDTIQASPDGALIFDSVGGEQLAVRLVGKTEGWKRFSLYRIVPESGTISVTLAMTGLGQVAFDDIRIEPMVPAAK